MRSLDHSTVNCQQSIGALAGSEHVRCPFHRSTMSRHRRKTSWRIPLRRLWAALVLVAYLIAIVGFPIPVFQDGSSSGQQPCGCLSAEQCRHCCCARGGDSSCESTSETCHGCACCCGGGEGESTGCGNCSTEGVQWVSSVSALACKGLSLLWVSAGVSFPPKEPALDCPAPVPGDWLSWHDDRPQGRSVTPPDPPPRRQLG